MEFNNKTLLICGLVIGGICSLYYNQADLSYAIFGGLIGYLSKDSVRIIKDEAEDGVDE